MTAQPEVVWKVGDEWAPFHTSASHVDPCYRDGWNNAYRAAQASLTAALAERDEARNLAERLKQEAQIHAQEARAANASLADCYQACTGATGEPGNWHGANPVRALVAERDKLAKELGEAVALMRALDTADAACTQDNWVDTHGAIIDAWEQIRAFLTAQAAQGETK